MLTAYRDALARYGTFRGRSSRSQFWFYNLTVFVLLAVCAAIDISVFGRTPQTGMILTGLTNLAHFVPSLAVMVRRLHDTDRSGWWLLIGFIPLVGQIVLFVFACQASMPGPNSYGAEAGWGDDTDPLQNTRPRASQGPQRASQHAGAGGGRRDGTFAEPSFGDPAPAATPSTTQTGIIAELRELADLRAQGVLDEAEFQRLKAEALTRRSDGSAAMGAAPQVQP